jgi:hypothetical protein
VACWPQTGLATQRVHCKEQGIGRRRDCRGKGSRHTDARCAGGARVCRRPQVRPTNTEEMRDYLQWCLHRLTLSCAGGARVGLRPQVRLLQVQAIATAGASSCYCRCKQLRPAPLLKQATDCPLLEGRRCGRLGYPNSDEEARAVESRTSAACFSSPTRPPVHPSTRPPDQTARRHAGWTD